MTQADASKLKEPGDVARYFLGSVLNGGGEDPPAGNSVEAWTAHYETYQNAALRTRLKIPILYGIDAVHGHSNVLGATIFPHNIGLGCTRNPALVEKAAEVTARGGARHRHPVDLRAHGVGGARRALGADVRGVRRVHRAVPRHGRGRRPRLPGREPARPEARPRLRQALRRRRRDDLRHGTAREEGRVQREVAHRPRRHAPHGGGAAAPAAAALRRRHRGRRGHGHDLVQHLERRAGPRQPPPDDRHPEGRARLQGLPDLRLGGHRRDPRRLQERRRDLHQRRPGHGDGAGQVPRVLQHPEVAGGGRPHPHGAHRRRGAPHPARQGGDGPPGRRGQRHGRPPPARVLRLRGASRGRPRGGPPVAGAPEERGQGAAAREGRPHPRRRAQPPTTSATSAAAGPSSGRARAGPSPPAGPRSCRRSAGRCPRRRR